ncbi:MAG: NAD(P)-binding domain-containing protein [Conexivisphaerales archaeon]
MKERIAIVGGTGRLGKGLALRLMKEHEVLIGSRSKEKADTVAGEVVARAEKLYSTSGYKGRVEGEHNQSAVERSAFIILAVQAEQLELFLSAALNYRWDGKVVLSPITRMKRADGMLDYHPFESQGRMLSAAEFVQSKLSRAAVVSGLQLLPASALWREKEVAPYDIPMAGDETHVRYAMQVLSCIPNLRYLYAGPLHVSYLIESALPLLLNIAMKNGFNSPGLRVLA